ncbi:MAG TPA: NAD(+)/NADH kinase [Ignavibacteriaceae bacterium]|nr:NAD(+)/NADH kinase [Ignavibacteriaceae bacterium]
MLIGIIANVTKENVFEVVASFLSKLKKNKLDYILTKSLSEDNGKIKIENFDDFVTDDKEVYEKADLIISIGGDGTMLATAFNAQFYDKPVLGVNLGKLGFLVEANIDQMDNIIKELKEGRYSIEERMVISGLAVGHEKEKLYAINDIVIDKGGWPKMIELTIWVGGEYVTTFSADGLIVATPTGSTGYSISVGGPIVSPKTDVITLSPISPHSLTIRPLVLPSSQEILIKADSPYKEIQVSCDRQRVFDFPPPTEIRICKSDRPLKLVHTSLTTYFETLRNKLLWGIDLRLNKQSDKE